VAIRQIANKGDTGTTVINMDPSLGALYEFLPASPACSVCSLIAPPKKYPSYQSDAVRQPCSKQLCRSLISRKLLPNKLAYIWISMLVKIK